MVKTSLASGW